MAVVLAAGFLAGIAVSSASTSGLGKLLSSSPLADSSQTASMASNMNDGEDSGWKTIHVFYGTREHLPEVSAIGRTAFESKTFYSQDGVRQDEIVSALFRRKRGGYFVDLAANDAVFYSNTFALETSFGWKGLCIEPSNVYWPSLSYRRCQVVGAVVGNDREEIQFQFRAKGLFGGIRGDSFSTKYNKEDVIQPRVTVSLEAVLDKFDAPRTIDFMSLDVEGAESLVLQAPLLERYRFNVLTIERPKLELRKVLVNHGYVEAAKRLSDWGETLWLHSSAVDELDISGAGIELKKHERVLA
jgi:hypothetical protein